MIYSLGKVHVVINRNRWFTATIWVSLWCAVCVSAAVAVFSAPARVDIKEGFEVSDLSQLKNWEVMTADPSSVALDTTVSHSGKTSLRVQSGNGRGSEDSRTGVSTPAIPYRGQLIKVSAWMKTQDVVAGTMDWLMAAVQVNSYDSGGRNIGHTDIMLKNGTSDWTEYRGEFRLSRTVKYVRLVCHMWGDSKGTAWFDDISFELVEDELSLANRVEDLGKATVTVDFGKSLGEFRHNWVGTDANYPDRAATPSGKAAMREAKKIGFKYVRLHECVFSVRVYSEDAQGNPQYNWKFFDDGIGALLECGMLPVVVLETMPIELAGKYSGKSWSNPYPPKDREALLRWQELCYQVVKHCRDKWGSAIHNWYFEVWNEPDATHYFEGTLEQYLKIYDHAVAGATRADSKITIGGVGGAGPWWAEPFLEHCARGKNDATGKTGARTDYFSWHIYTVGTGMPLFDALKISLNKVKSAVKKHPQYSKLPLLITEWGCSSNLFDPHDRPYDAAFRTMAIRTFLDYGITLNFPFCLTETPYGKMQGFRGDLSMYTQTTIPKPSARAFELLSRMSGTRVKCASSNDPVGGVACVSRDRKRAWVMLYNLIEDYERPQYDTAVTLKLPGLPKGEWKCEVVRIAQGECDPYVKWLELGSPNPLSPEQQSALMEASKLPKPEAVVLRNGQAKLSVPGFSVAMVELVAEK